MGKKGKWFSAVKKVFSSSGPDGKEAKVCQNSLFTGGKMAKFPVHRGKNGPLGHQSSFISIYITCGYYEG